MGKVLGLDLGSMFSKTAYRDDSGVVKIIDTFEGETSTHNSVFFDSDGCVIVGYTAKMEGLLYPECLVECVREHLGREDFLWKFNGKEYSSVDIFSFIIKKIVTDAESCLGENIEGVVISCPYWLDDQSRNALKEAVENVELANQQRLQVLYMLEEQSAITTAYLQTFPTDSNKNILIYDIGATYTKCYLTQIVIESGEKRVRHIAKAYIKLGGNDWTKVLEDVVRRKFCELTGCDFNEMKSDVESCAWFSENIEKLKRVLSKRESATVIPAFGEFRERITITREDFNEATGDLLNKVVDIINTMLLKNDIDTEHSFDEIVVVGGASKMPQIVDRLKCEHNKPIILFDSEFAVAKGATWTANELWRRMNSEENKKRNTIIGIDLGTTYSCVSYVDENNIIRIIDNMEGEQKTPSVVFFDPNGTAEVGFTAKAEGVLYPDRLVERVKNFMGAPDYSFFANGVGYSATDISALILQKLVRDAQEYLDDEIEGAVITCPAYFDDQAKHATKAAAEKVILSNGKNLKVIDILDEPTAAAIAFGNSRQEDMDKTVLIYDLGGGTFDCTVMKISFSGDDCKMSIIAKDGNHQLGGKDWDEALANLIREKFCSATGCDIEEMKSDAESVAWFSESIEKAKKNLTYRESTSLSPAFNGCRERVEVTREEFEDVTYILLDQTIMLVNDMLEKNGLNVMNDIDEIVLVGGSSKMPQIIHRLEVEYSKPITSYESDKLVAMGAAIFAANNYNCVFADDSDSVEIDGKIIDWFGDSWASKSVGIKLYFEGREQILNLVLKGDSLPKKVNSKDFIEISAGFTDDVAEKIKVTLIKNDSCVRMCDIDEYCSEYAEIEFDTRNIKDNDSLNLSLYIDANAPDSSCIRSGESDMVDTLSLMNARGEELYKSNIIWKEKAYLTRRQKNQKKQKGELTLR